MLFETCEPRLPFASDFGDAPDVYGTLLASNGPHHLITPGVFLGANVDAELDGQPSADATGDNTNGGTTSPPGDEQGVDFDQPLQPGGVTSLEVSANVSGYLSAWIDFNADGDFADAGEKIAGPGALGFPIAVHAIGAGPNRISFLVPPDAVVGNTFARFRFTTDSGDLTPTGVLLGGVEPDGEVEDYQITIEPPVDFGDAPDSYGSKLASDGARHTIVSGLFLGTYVDPEPDAPPRPDLTDPTNTIDEDDEDEEWDQFGTNDDDGVFGVNCTVTAGEVCELAVEASAAGQLDAWFDFNGDGD
ncbi:MAG: hypothetical protein KDA62_08105, partial [Planctomycetales bacterium]|nr:hypothetical protein [Planctomycetales bacterium]